MLVPTLLQTHLLSDLVSCHPGYEIYLVLDNSDLVREDITWERVQLLIVETVHIAERANARIKKLLTVSYTSLHVSVFDKIETIMARGPPEEKRNKYRDYEAWRGSVYSRMVEVDTKQKPAIRTARQFLDEIGLDTGRSLSGTTKRILQDWNAAYNPPPSNFIIFTSMRNYTHALADMSRKEDITASANVQLLHNAHRNLMIQLVVVLNDESELATFQTQLNQTPPESRFIRSIYPCVIRPATFAVVPFF